MSTGKWANPEFQTALQPTKLTIGEMGRLEKVRLAEEKVQTDIEEKQRCDPSFYQMTEEKINKMIVDYNSDVSGHSEDDDRSVVHKKKRRKCDQQTLVHGESLVNKVDEFLKNFNQKMNDDNDGVQGEVLIENEMDGEKTEEVEIETDKCDETESKEEQIIELSHEEIELDKDGHSILFGDWRTLSDSEGDQYYWNVKTNETSWELPQKPTITTQSISTQTAQNPLPISRLKLAETAQLLTDKLSAIIRETGPSISTPQLTRKTEFKIRFLDWREGELSDAYFFRHILELGEDLKNYEENVLTEDLGEAWSVEFDVKLKVYEYYHKVTKEAQTFYPNDRLPHLVSVKVVELE